MRSKPLPSIRGLYLTAAAVVAASCAIVGPATAATTRTPAPPARSGDTTDTTARPPIRSAFAPGRYIVTLATKPVATYEGGVAGIARTRPAKGAKVNAASSDARALGGYLRRQQDSAAGSVHAVADQHFTVALNGFSAKLTAAQATALSHSAGVTSVVPDKIHTIQDDKRSTDFLGLSGKSGLWKAAGGTKKAGKGIVVGDIDTGIWPEATSFAGPALGAEPVASAPFRAYRDGAAIVQHKADGSTFTGACQTGEQFTATACNTKLISARYFDAGFLDVVGGASGLNDYQSARDGEGHGTHTASTAAGDAGVEASIHGRDFGDISGVAPAASIAVYKALWTGKTTSGGTTSDIVAAIDQAVSDGVDVINYSVGSIFESDVNDPVQLAFLSAASAGIFVATAGGNAGPDASSLDNTAPWTTTVAASTIAPYLATVKLGNGHAYAGASVSVTATVGPKPLVRSGDIAAPGAAASDAALCQPSTLDPDKAKDKIVVCDRGVNDRVAKSAEVQRAGGAGMVLVNLTDLDTDADAHSVPTVHLNTPDATAVRDYAATSGATATLVPGNTSGASVPYPQIAGFSSRGPSRSNSGDLLKPDIAAPGVSILAAVAPPTNSGDGFAFESGTSMATPHIAGLAAIYLGLHPTMSPMAIKSALMTTAKPTKNADGSVNEDVFAQGAGEVTPRSMLDPGVVYDSSDNDWLAYLTGRGVNTGVPGISTSQLNSPSIASGHLLGTETFTRTLTAETPGLYHATISVPGMQAKVSPGILNFGQAGDTHTFTVTLTQTTAPSGRATSGSLTWSGAGTAARSPIVVTPVGADAPAQVSGSGKSGSVSYQVTPGSDRLSLRAYGLVSGPAQKGAVDGSDPNNQAAYPFTVTATTKAVQVTSQTEDPNAAAAVILVQGDYATGGSILAFGDVASRSQITESGLEPGHYTAYVVALSNAPGTTSTPFTYRANIVDASDAGHTLSVSPATATAPRGQAFTATAKWTGADADVPATGYVEYPHGTGTVVSVN
ncbi:S8 family peptidase [Actinomadura sp. DC4]|uniref:S8 family peptidase n=1 Tax=Actinomadura sp. DC4 TaxID=3055069 RepID=UPI0025B1AE24|nr:S8 family peptidase [Actinomadura sp. DC4]MDN3357905.1 S8 family peptidase [Actinomadura sp. DC4]